MPSEPLVTIVTPSLNSASYIRGTITSVLEQDYPRIEYIIVDGHSTDGTREILDEYSGRLSVAFAPPNGAPAAINSGFQRGSGNIFAWLSADDTYQPGAVASAVKHLLENPAVAVVYGDAHWIDSEDKPIGMYPARPFSSEALARECIIAQPAAFISGAGFREVGMLDPGEKLAFDYDLWIRLSKQHRFLYIPEHWANSRMHRNAITFRDRGSVLEASMRVLDKHYGYVPLQWIYGAQCYRRDHRDQFFEPLHHSATAYALSLPYGLMRNYKRPVRFAAEWLSRALQYRPRRK